MPLHPQCQAWVSVLVGLWPSATQAFVLLRRGNGPRDTSDFLKSPSDVFVFILLIDLREEERDLLFHLLMHVLVASCMCSARGSNLRPLVYWDDGQGTQ